MERKLKSCMALSIYMALTKQKAKVTPSSSHGSRVTSHAFGFTLAEILIVVGVIGVVATTAIPPLIENINERVWNARSKDTLAKLSEATNQMKVEDMLSGFANTDKFVDELQKKIKITKRCDAQNLDKCFTPKIKIEGEDPILTKNLQTSKKIFKTTTDNNNPTVGIMTIDGMPMVLSFDQNCERLDPFSNTPRNTAGTSATLACMHILYDTNGMQKPNTYGKDIKGYQVVWDNGCIIEVGGTCFSSMALVPLRLSGCPVNFEGLGNKYPCAANGDAWIGAMKACKDQEMRLTNDDELATLANYLSNTNTASGSTIGIDITDRPLNEAEAGKLGIINGSALWSSTERDGNSAYYRGFYNSRSERNDYTKFGVGITAICVLD